MTDSQPLRLTKFPGWDDIVATVSESHGKGAMFTFKDDILFEKGQELILLKPKEEDSKLISSGGETQSTSSKSKSIQYKFEDVFLNNPSPKVNLLCTLHTFLDGVIDKVLVYASQTITEDSDLFIFSFKHPDPYSFDGSKDESSESADDDDANKKLDPVDISSRAFATQAVDTNTPTFSLLTANFESPNKDKPRNLWTGGEYSESADDNDANKKEPDVSNDDVQPNKKKMKPQDPWEPITFKSFTSMLIVEVMVKDGEEVKAYQPLIKYKPIIKKSSFSEYDGMILDEESGYWVPREPWV